MPPAKRGARRTSARVRENIVSPARDRPRIEVELEELSSSNPTCCILIHGENGAGKTALAGGITHSKRAGLVAFCSTERGTISAKRTGSKAKLWRAAEWERVEAFLDWADENMHQDDWLIMDSVTRMQVLLQRYILKDNHELRGSDIDEMQLQMWQLWQTKFLRFIDRMIESDYNSVLICSSMDANDKDGDPLIVPSIYDTKKSNNAGYVRAQPDEVYYLGITHVEGEPVRRLLTQFYPPWFSKSRLDIFERWLDIPEGTYDTLGWMVDEIMSARDSS